MLEELIGPERITFKELSKGIYRGFSAMFRNNIIYSVNYLLSEHNPDKETLTQPEYWEKNGEEILLKKIGFEYIKNKEINTENDFNEKILELYDCGMRIAGISEETWLDWKYSLPEDLRDECKSNKINVFGKEYYLITAVYPAPLDKVPEKLKHVGLPFYKSDQVTKDNLFAIKKKKVFGNEDKESQTYIQLEDTDLSCVNRGEKYALELILNRKELSRKIFIDPESAIDRLSYELKKAFIVFGGINSQSITDIKLTELKDRWYIVRLLDEEMQRKIRQIKPNDEEFMQIVPKRRRKAWELINEYQNIKAFFEAYKKEVFQK